MKMGRHFATCGHEIDEFTDGLSVAVKGYNRKGERVVDYRVLCPKCLKEYGRDGQILETREAEDRWN